MFINYNPFFPDYLFFSDFYPIFLYWSMVGETVIKKKMTRLIIVMEKFAICFPFLFYKSIFSIFKRSMIFFSLKPKMILHSVFMTDKICCKLLSQMRHSSHILFEFGFKKMNHFFLVYYIKREEDKKKTEFTHDRTMHVNQQTQRKSMFS